MNKYVKNKLLNIAEEKITGDDPSHDLNHALRVLSTAEKIASEEQADLDIVVPSALFHDVINYPKNDPKRMQNAEESAEVTRNILHSIPEYPKEKIDDVAKAIKLCSFTKGIVPDFLEAKILQDADGLEATGAISIMRTFASTGSMKRTFYNSEDPFAENREPDDMKYALDLFYTRLLKVKERMHTDSAKKIAERRTAFLEKFLQEFELELKGE
jgi:uncharacterized protein